MPLDDAIQQMSAAVKAAFRGQRSKRWKCLRKRRVWASMPRWYSKDQGDNLSTGDWSIE